MLSLPRRTDDPVPRALQSLLPRQLAGAKADGPGLKLAGALHATRGTLDAAFAECAEGVSDCSTAGSTRRRFEGDCESLLRPPCSSWKSTPSTTSPRKSAGC